MNGQKDINYTQMLVSGTALGGTEMEIITYVLSHLPFPSSLPPFSFPSCAYLRNYIRTITVLILVLPLTSCINSGDYLNQSEAYLVCSFLNI